MEQAASPFMDVMWSRLHLSNSRLCSVVPQLYVVHVFMLSYHGLAVHYQAKQDRLIV